MADIYGGIMRTRPKTPISYFSQIKNPRRKLANAVAEVEIRKYIWCRVSNRDNMNLLDYTSRIQMFLFFLLFGIFSILFYFVLTWNILRNIDEILYNRKTHLLAFLKENP